MKAGIGGLGYRVIRLLGAGLASGEIGYRY